MIKIEDIIFWILIATIIGITIWLLTGSPPIENGLLIITIFVATSELLLWKSLFKMDKKTAVSFEKLKNNMNNKFGEVNSNLKEIKTLIKNKWQL